MFPSTSIHIHMRPRIVPQRQTAVRALQRTHFSESRNMARSTPRPMSTLTAERTTPKLDSRGVALKPLPRRLTQAKPETLPSPKRLPTSPPRLVSLRVRDYSAHHLSSSNPQWRVKRRFVKSSLFSSLMQYQTSPPFISPLSSSGREVGPCVNERPRPPDMGACDVEFGQP
jgi:hypothetical protein